VCDCYRKKLHLFNVFYDPTKAEQAQMRSVKMHGDNNEKSITATIIPDLLSGMGAPKAY